MPATEFLIAPAVESVMPAVERRPAEDRAPVSTVLVPETVDTMFPPSMLSPLEDCRPVALIPPAKVLEAVDVALSAGRLSPV